MTSPPVQSAGAHAGEARLLPDLVRFLWVTRRVRESTVVLEELAWRGRRIDLATLSISGVSNAYELKLGNFGRVLEQAIYNKLSFDRSWTVVGTLPNVSNLHMAEKYGIGVLVVTDRVRLAVPAPLARAEYSIRRRLAEKFLTERGRRRV